MNNATLTDDLGTLLKQHIKGAVIIDDAFDLNPKELIDDSSLSEFTNAVSADKAIADELRGYVDLDSVFKGQREALVTLAKGRKNYDKAAPVVEQLCGKYFEQTGPLTDLEDNLTKLGIPVRTFGAAEHLPDELAADIAFIDYYLDGEPSIQEIEDGADRGVKAQHHARNIYLKTKAFIVLMSNRGGVKELQGPFRRQAKLLKGFFKFVKKETLSDAETLRATLSVLPLEANFRHTLHEFVDSLEVSAEAAKSNFLADVRDLGLEDYMQLRRLSLNREAHPFGDYLLKMFAAYLTSLVVDQDELNKRVQELDETTFESLLPVQDEPSAILGRIYLSSLTERVRKPAELPHNDGTPKATPALGNADRTPQVALATAAEPIAPSSNAIATLPRVELGDLFIKDSSSPVYVVMNPACDLMIGGKRKREADDTVLLIPGSMRQLHEKLGTDRSPTFITPMFLHNNHVYRIDWDYRKLKTVPHDCLAREMHEFTREQRLQLGPALELQLHFTSAMARVGLPVPPPLGRSLDALVYCRGIDGKWCALEPQMKRACIVYHMEKEDSFVIPGAAREEILGILRTHIDFLVSADPNLPWQEKGNRSMYVRSLESSTEKWTAQFPFYRDFGTLQKGASSLKLCGKFQRFGIAMGIEVFKETDIDADAVLSLDWKPIVLSELPEPLAEEMDGVA